MADIDNLQDSFRKAAGTYEFRMGQVTRKIAHHIVTNLTLPENAHVCDNACGTGVMTEVVLEAFPDATMAANDIAPPMVKIVESANQNRVQSGHVQVRVANSVQLPYADATFDAQIMNFGIFFTPDPVAAAQEIYRTLKPGGSAVVTCWQDTAFFRLTFMIQDIIKPANPLHGLPMFDAWKDS